MFEKPKRKRSPKHRLTLLDWRWRLLILVVIYGLIMLINIPLNILIFGLIPFGLVASAAFGIGYVITWCNERIVNYKFLLRVGLFLIGFFTFVPVAGFLQIISLVTVLSSDNSVYLSVWLTLLTFIVLLFSPMLLVIHIGMAGEKFAIRNYQQRNQSKAKREFTSSERLSDEDDADDDSLEMMEQSESNVEQQKFNSLED
jgi:hypothetical protein